MASANYQLTDTNRKYISTHKPNTIRRYIKSKKLTINGTFNYLNFTLRRQKKSKLNQNKYEKSESENHSVCPTLCDPMDYTVHGILQARILEWVAGPFSRGSSQTRDQTQVSRIAGGFFTTWATREAQEFWHGVAYPFSSRSSWPRNQNGVFCSANRFFTSWDIREVQNTEVKHKEWKQWHRKQNQ